MIRLRQLFTFWKRREKLGDLLHYAQALSALARGTGYLLYFGLRNRRVKIRFPFKAYAPVTIVGPGRVEIDRHCFVYKNVFKGLQIVTMGEGAEVRIGKRCALGGVAIRCRGRVEIGDQTMTAISLVQDVPFLSPRADVTEWEPLNGERTRGTRIGRNVWLGAQSMVLGPCSVGKDSVLAAGAMVLNDAQGDYRLISGSPARTSLPIDRVLKFKRKL